MKAVIRREMHKVYKLPEAAFSDMDYNGRGYIEEADFFKTLICYRLPFTNEELAEFFHKEKLFRQRADGTADFEQFTKTFFPHRQ